MVVPYTLSAELHIVWLYVVKMLHMFIVSGATQWYTYLIIILFL